METAIGVFTSRDQAEKALKELRPRGVTGESIVFLTRSKSEAETITKEFGAFVGGIVGGAAGITTGVVATTLLLPGIGTVFALGIGAAALLTGAGAGSAIGLTATHEADALQPATAKESPEDVAFFQEVLKEGRSLIVVRTESQELASSACEVLDRLGLGMRNRTPVKMQTTTRHIGDVAVLDILGRITLGEGNVMLREIVRELMEKGNAKIVLNLSGVQYVDSSGLGELIKTHTTIRHQGGQLRLVNLSKRVSDLLQITKLSAVFDIDADETTAVKSLRDNISQAVA
jgi:anti-sigma B factor antagonist